MPALIHPQIFQDSHKHQFGCAALERKNDKPLTGNPGNSENRRNRQPADGRPFWLQRFMHTVAKRRIFCALAAAKPFLFSFGHGKFYRCECRALVRTVAKRLLFRLAAGTPPVITGREFQRIGRFLRAGGFGHGGVPLLTVHASFCAIATSVKRAGYHPLHYS